MSRAAHPSMASKQTAVVRWTGRGRFADLLSSVEFVLADNRVGAKVTAMGWSVLVTGPGPIEVAALLGAMPGVSWVAAGVAANSLKELGDAAGVLGRRYLRKGYTFAVEAEGTGGTKPGDLAGAVVSKILETTKGARVSESPKTRFKAAFDGRGGAVGVEVKAGVGGVPTGSSPVVCLVSGGVHSSVLAWMAMLQGFRVQLVHAEVDEASLRAVARLYSELSHRGDPRWLGLEAISGKSMAGALRAYASATKMPMFAGFHPADKRIRTPIRRAEAPLYLMPEEWFRAEYSSLGLSPYEASVDWNARGAGISKSRRFGGKRADVSGVLDGLR